MPFAEAPVACDAFVAASLVSAAVEMPSLSTEAVSWIEKLANDALSRRSQTAFRSTGFREVAELRLPNSILYQGLVLLTLAGLERLSPENALSTTFDAIAGSLAERLTQSVAGFLPSFGESYVWPCDHAPAAAALLLHGVLRPQKKAISEPAGIGLTQRLSDMLHYKRGFPTRISPAGKVLEATPRGTVLAFTSAFLRHGPNQELANRFSKTFAETFCEETGGYAACREWPKGIDHPMDAVSGPMIGGFAVAPSGLGLAATHNPIQMKIHQLLDRTARTAGLDLILSMPQRFPLENAIYLWASTVRPWVEVE
ncbi:MAG: hypothetical protein A2289_06860 [Deltaproteobacteria bacterium RIFOXYA12_FULL_58_15]|nr:MAG: hypothetical protein A2289_06860 [Deltaproteobacteria bacterium RIFOXYA12_FULL_58_15]OGR14430.1 MAG: hypothetical protein A2341_04670 [Deltaproteobacteria bacterium RIFOXYB12_FULL_58_9]